MGNYYSSETVSIPTVADTKDAPAKLTTTTNDNNLYSIFKKSSELCAEIVMYSQLPTKFWEYARADHQQTLVTGSFPVMVANGLLNDEHWVDSDIDIFTNKESCDELCSIFASDKYYNKIEYDPAITAHTYGQKQQTDIKLQDGKAVFAIGSFGTTVLKTCRFSNQITGRDINIIQVSTADKQPLSKYIRDNFDMTMTTTATDGETMFIPFPDDFYNLKSQTRNICVERRAKYVKRGIKFY